MMSATGEHQALEEAAEWLMRLNEGGLNEHERVEWLAWQASSPARAHAWQRAQLLQSKLGGLPPTLAMAALDRPASRERRALVGKLAVLLAVLPTGWAGWKVFDTGHWSADYRSAVGERRELTLADGSQLTLNTDTAIDVRFDDQQRLIRMLAGELLVQTASDRRPLRVSTAQGRMQALGTRFIVRVLKASTRLQVLEGAVQVQLNDAQAGAARRVNAGQSVQFTSREYTVPLALDPAAGAWTRGMLLADNQRLDDFIAELGRYRPGVLRCDPAIAGLRVAGAFPLQDTRRALQMLAQTYSLTVSEHLGGYWTTLSAT
ncbi:FecR domain-containing protein [Pseudomonas sp. LJDD11]|uniref:FecR domain-containing protein n=2 Tax=unclassified Pseudomonas TaxID=196821 RepID=UPI00211CD5F7|nr:FecR domain-containing protein [Pseudomonas sp. LJDD11]